MIQVYESTSDDAFITERLLSFDSVRFHPSDPMYITFHGRAAERNFKLQSEEAMASMWIVLQKYVDLLSVPGKARTFMMVLKKRPSVKPSSVSWPTATPEHGMERHNSVPETRSIGRTSPSLVVSSSSMDVIFPGGRFSRFKKLGVEIELPDKIIFDTWCHILNIDLSSQRKAGFHQLHILWREIPYCQWVRNASFRKIVRSLEDSMPSITLESPPISRMPFDVLMHCMFLTGSVILTDSNTQSLFGRLIVAQNLFNLSIVFWIS
jgi:hypothetical protein